MPINLANAFHFTENSDYPFDKVVLLKTGSFVLPANTTDYDVTVAHNFGEGVLLGGRWSLSSDFSTSYDFGTGIAPSTNPPAPFDQIVTVNSGSADIHLLGTNATSVSVTVYYQVFGFLRYLSPVEIEPIASAGDVLLHSSDYTNSKLLVEGYGTVPNTTTATTYNLTHGLGYIPQANSWVVNGGYLWRANDPHPSASAITVTIDEVNMYWHAPAGTPASQVFYRIYLDN